MTRRCASQTPSPLTDSLYKAKKSWRRSTWSATSRWCPLSSLSSCFFTSAPSSPLWSSRSQPGCGPCSKLVEGLWLSARRSHRSSEVHRLPPAGVQVRIFALGLRLLLLFCVFYYNITLQPRKHCVLDGLRALSEFGGKSGCWEAQLGQVALFVFFLFSKYHLQDCVDRHHVFDHHSGQYYDHLDYPHHRQAIQFSWFHLHQLGPHLSSGSVHSLKTLQMNTDRNFLLCICSLFSFLHYFIDISCQTTLQ